MAERELTMAAAISEGIAQEMERDENVFVMGEDVAKYGGIFGATGGLLDQFGAERVMDTPISETAFIGAATGAAAEGMRPIVELMFVDFFGVFAKGVAGRTYFADPAITASGCAVLSAVKNNLQMEIIPA